MTIQLMLMFIQCKIKNQEFLACIVCAICLHLNTRGVNIKNSYFVSQFFVPALLHLALPCFAGERLQVEMEVGFILKGAEANLYTLREQPVYEGIQICFRTL